MVSASFRCELYRVASAGVASLVGLLVTWSVVVATAQTFTVTATDDADDGACTVAHCSLREAIGAANANDGRDTIAFLLSGRGPFIIRPDTPLPPTTDAVVIDGTTQPGFAGVPLIELEGDLPAAGVAFGLRLHGGDSVVRGLRMTLADVAAIEIRGPGRNVIQGNYVGTTANGRRPAGNGHGVWIVDSPNNIIGGTTPEERNLISGNLVNGVTIEGPNASGNRVTGNYIGTNVNGTEALPNGRHGVVIVGAPINVVGGSAPGAGNVISGNDGSGVRILGPTASDNRVQGNHIGVDVSGQFAIGNGGKGVWIRSPNNLIGGVGSGEGNIISNSSLAGLIIQSAWATGNRVEGNVIGTDITLRKPFGNDPYGVRVHQAPNNMIGGRDPAQGNVIAHSSVTGVFVTESTSNAILSNSIYGSGALGIDLSVGGADAGITPNDEGDVDVGTNNLQNFPVIDDVIPSGTGAVLRGRLNGTPDAMYLIQLFANPRCDVSAFGEGRQLVSSFDVTTDASGNATFDVPVDENPRASFSATATDALNNTSEFARCRPFRGGVAAPQQSALGAINVVRSRYDGTLGHNIADLAVAVAEGVADAGFLTFYENNGGLTRWGLPTSEAFEERSEVLVQYFQRGKLEWREAADGHRRIQRVLAWDFVGGGVDGAPDLGVEPGLINANPGDLVGPWGHKVSNTSVEGERVGFQDFFDAHGGVDSFGLPKTDARRDSHPDAILRQPDTSPALVRQYFQAAVLEWNPTDAASVKVTLIGDLLRDLAYPLESWRQIQAFQPTPPLVAG